MNRPSANRSSLAQRIEAAETNGSRRFEPNCSSTARMLSNNDGSARTTPDEL
jgi:hypothetical protein